MTEPITLAELDWTGQGLPLSRRYGDVYFSDQGGLEESRHVFLAGNHLHRRLATAQRFTIGETGFGSGLNFLALWQLWERIAPVGARLCFFSAEKHPLHPDDMARIHALFPEIAGYGAALREALPLPVPGYHRMYLAGGKVQLTLMYGDALDMMRQQDAQADAWFLDGFAPRLNPDLWSAELAAQLRRLSAPGCTVATFSTSTSTMEALAGAGFTLEKSPGFGRKKHMLSGFLPGEPPVATMPDEVQVIGGGLAGAATAYAFARRGCRVTVHEQAQQAAGGASGNPSAIFYPGVTVGWQPVSRFYYMGFSHTRGVLRELAKKHAIAHDFCGMLLFPKPREDAGRQAKVLASMQPDASVFYGVDAVQASEIAGMTLPKGGLYFPASGWVNLRDMTQALLAQPGITLRTDSAVEALPEAPLTVLCNGWQAGRVYPPLAGTIHAVQGQTTRLAGNAELAGLRCVLSYGGYLTPAIAGEHHLGATYEKGEFKQAETHAEGLAENVRKLETFLGRSVAQAPVGGWAGLRSVTRDRLPIVGKLQDGLYANLAHASKGLLSCALAGEYLASLAGGEPLPVPGDLAGMVGLKRC